MFEHPKIAENRIEKKEAKTIAQELIEKFKKTGVESSLLKIEENVVFPEIVFLEKKQKPKEKYVRIYRGVNKLDESLLEQLPYTMRKGEATGEILKIENIKEETENLANNPTYENLTIYIKKVLPHLSEKEKKNIYEELEKIEDNILKGSTLETELQFSQFMHCGGNVCDRGISPYISATFDPKEALTYGVLGMIIADIPITKMKEYNLNTEVSVKGSLETKYVTAIVPRNLSVEKEGDETQKEIDNILQKVDEHTDIDLYEGTELESIRKDKIAEDHKKSEKQQKKDLQEVNKKRTNELKEKFPEIFEELDLQESKMVQIIDLYSETKKRIFDYYIKSLKEDDRKIVIEEYKFTEHEYTRQLPFRREEITDLMLVKLREVVSRFKESYKRRERYRHVQT